MYLAKVKSLDFIPNPNEHTVTYDQVARKAAFEQGGDRNMDGQIEHVIASSYDEAVELLRAVVRDYLARFVAASLNPKDFTFSAWVSPVINNRLWISCSQCAGTHPA